MVSIKKKLNFIFLISSSESVIIIKQIRGLESYHDFGWKKRKKFTTETLLTDFMELSGSLAWYGMV